MTRFSLVKTTIWLALIFVVIQPIAGPVQASEIKNNFKQKVKKITLPNGLRVIMLRKTNAPVVALYIKFKVGGVDEHAEITGTAHLLEHMLFKGSKKLGTRDYEAEEKYLQVLEQWNNRIEIYKLKRRLLVPGKQDAEIKKLDSKIDVLAKRIASLTKTHKQFVIKEHDALIYNINGQSGFNAYTSKDVTNYQINLPANKLEVWAAIESDRLRDPVLREYYTERDVVIEERRMRYESQGIRKLREKYLAAAFEAHPYRHPIIGYMSNIPFLNKSNTERFFRKYYAPNNMVIGIVGNIDFADTEGIIKKYFGDLKPSKLPPPLKVVEPQQNGERRVRVHFPSGERMIIGWHKPTLPHPDNITFELLSSVLTSGRSSILTRRLVYEEALALSVSSWNGDPGERYNNLLSLFITPIGEAAQPKIEEIVYQELDKIAKNGIDPGVLDKYKNKMLTDFYRSLDSNGGLADNLTYYELIYGDWSFLFDFYDELGQVTSADIQRVVKKYMTRRNRTVAILVRDKKKGAAQ